MVALTGKPRIFTLSSFGWFVMMLPHRYMVRTVHQVSKQKQTTGACIRIDMPPDRQGAPIDVSPVILVNC